MKKETITTRVKTKKPITDSQMLHALRDSMGPVFAYFEEELQKSDGKTLHIEVTAKKGSVKLCYGVTDIDAANDRAEAGDASPPETGSTK